MPPKTLRVREEVTAKDITKGAKQKLEKIQLFKVALVKERAVAYPVNKIGSADDLAKVARSELAHLPHEEVIAIGLNRANIPIGVVKVAQGGLGSAGVHPQDVIRPLLGMGASAFVIAHNHPSGDPTPSQDDVHMTRALKKTAECVGLVLLDHLIIGSIVGGARWKSMSEMGFV